MLNSLKKQLIDKKELYLSVKIRPASSKTEFLDIMTDNTIKISVAAITEKGKANLELIKFLAKEFKVLKHDIKIISGAGGRTKLVKICL